MNLPFLCSFSKIHFVLLILYCLQMQAIRFHFIGSMFFDCFMSVHMMCMSTSTAAAMSAASTAAAAISASAAATAVRQRTCMFPVDHQTTVAKYKEQYNYICYHKYSLLSYIWKLVFPCAHYSTIQQFLKGTGCYHPAPLLCRFNTPTDVAI